MTTTKLRGIEKKCISFDCETRSTSKEVLQILCSVSITSFYQSNNLD